MRCGDTPCGDAPPFCTKGNSARAPPPSRFPVKIARRGCDSGGAADEDVPSLPHKKPPNNSGASCRTASQAARPSARVAGGGNADEALGVVLAGSANCARTTVAEERRQADLETYATAARGEEATRGEAAARGEAAVAAAEGEKREEVRIAAVATAARTRESGAPPRDRDIIFKTTGYSLKFPRTVQYCMYCIYCTY